MAFWRILQHVCNVLVTCSVFCFAKLWDLSHVLAAGGGGAHHSRGYQVFLSFRGPDVRKGFVSHLYKELTRGRYNVFLDSHEINIGDDISAAIDHAIEHSRIFIIVFSCNFAESAWCLKEAALIARRLQRNGTQSERASVIPVFYDVTPSQVRHPHHDSPFAQAFQEHERRGKYRQQEIDEWKDALHTISDRRGLSLQEDYNGYEAELVKPLISLCFCLNPYICRDEAELVKSVVKEVGKLRRTARF